MTREKKIAIVNVVTGDKVVEGPVTNTTDEEDITDRIENLEKQEYLLPRLDKVEKDILILFDALDRHSEHLPSVGSSKPRRHNTYVVKEDGERIARIAKSELGNSGRYVEILSLNGITIGDMLKEGQVLDMPIE